MLSRYASTKQIDELYFSNCSSCVTSCCDGSRYLFLPLILEDFEEVYQYFPIVFAQIDGEYRALILLVDETGQCRYHQSGICAIYDTRPPGCRLYPITPYYEETLVDLSCPAVTKEGGNFLASQAHIGNSFYHQRMENFESKRQKSTIYIDQLDSFDLIGSVGGVTLYKYNGEIRDKYITMHMHSLVFLLNKEKIWSL